MSILRPAFDKLTIVDLEQTLAIENASRPSPWSLSQFKSEIEWQGTIRAFALRVDGELAGYAIMWNIAGELQIQNIVIDPKRRRQKLGEWLLQQLLHFGCEAGGRLATLEVRASNEPAIALYKKYRFELVGRRKNYYRHGEDALLMTLEPLDTDYRSFLAAQTESLNSRLA